MKRPKWLRMPWKPRAAPTEVLGRTGDSRYVPQIQQKIGQRPGRNGRIKAVLAHRLDEITIRDYDRVRFYPVVKDAIRSIVTPATRANIHFSCARQDIADLAQQELGPLIPHIVKALVKCGLEFGYGAIELRWIPKFDVWVTKPGSVVKKGEDPDGQYWPFVWSLQGFGVFSPSDSRLLINPVTGEFAGVRQYIHNKRSGDVPGHKCLHWAHEKEFTNYGTPLTKPALPFVEIAESYFDSSAIYANLFGLPGMVGRYPRGKTTLGADGSKWNADVIMELLESVQSGQKIALPSDLYDGTNERRWSIDFFAPPSGTEPYTQLIDQANNMIRLAMGVNEMASSETSDVGGLGDQGAEQKIGLFLANIESILEEVVIQVNKLADQFRIYIAGPDCPPLKAFFEPVDLNVTKALLSAIVDMLSSGQPIQDANGDLIYADWRKILHDKGVATVTVSGRDMATSLLKNAIDQIAARSTGQDPPAGKEKAAADAGLGAADLKPEKPELERKGAIAAVRLAIDRLDTAPAIKSLYRSMLATIEHESGKNLRLWDESEHPRDEDGKLAHGAAHEKITGAGHNIAPDDLWIQRPDGQYTNARETVATRDDAVGRAQDATSRGRQAAVLDPDDDPTTPSPLGPKTTPDGASGLKSEHDPAADAKPAILPRDDAGNPISQAPGTPRGYRRRQMPAHFSGSTQEWEAIESRSEARYNEASKIDPALEVKTGPEDPSENLQRVTSADTPEIMRVRAAVASFGHEATSGIKTPERLELRDQIAEDLYGAGAAKKERKMHLILGPPGSGKSTLVADQGLTDPAKLGALEIDSDMAKEQLPGFNGGRTALNVHEESDGIWSEIFGRAAAAGDNIVAPLIGKSADKIRNLISAMQSQGYEITVHSITMDPQRAAESVVARFHKTGRFVDPSYALNVDHLPTKSVQELRATFPDGVTFQELDSDELAKRRR